MRAMLSNQKPEDREKLSCHGKSVSDRSHLANRWLRPMTSSCAVAGGASKENSERDDVSHGLMAALIVSAGLNCIAT